MIETSPLYKELIVADSRKMRIKAVMDIVSPELQYGAVTGSTQTAYSIPAQLHDGITELQPYATLELNRWKLDGTFPIAYSGMTQEIAWESEELADEDRYFDTLNPCTFSLAISGISVLQGVTVSWPTADYDGIPKLFALHVRQGGTDYYARRIANNKLSTVVFEGFTVYNPDEIMIKIFRWSKPLTRARCPEIVPGLHEEWSGDDFSAFSVRQQGDFSCVSLPYGTATFDIDNSEKTFEPRSKTGLMQSIEERQGIKIFLGADGAELVPVGIYYQFANGWKTSDNALVMTWNLVDLIGLLVDRIYYVPETLPTTLQGWIENIVGQLGSIFEGFCIVDPDYASISLTVTDAETLADKTCGQILLWCCQATGTWPRADAETGKLAVEPFWSQGNSITLDNIEKYPTMSANKDVAYIRFNLPDGTVVNVQGTSVSSPNTIEISNPFIHDQASALAAAREILAIYGGNILTTIGRGDPSSEIGDVPTVQLDESTATTGRLYYQDFIFTDGVLKGCTSQILQSDWGDIYDTSVVFTASGTWTVPAGVTEAKVILVGGGYGGGRGQDGTMEAPGLPGTDGEGGKVFYGDLNIVPGNTFTVTIGAGGTANSDPGDTTFGAYTSADGHTYYPSYTDIQSGAAYGRTGVANPQGNGDGGKGGAGGTQGSGYVNVTTTTKYILYPTNGQPYEISEYIYNALAQGSPTGDPNDIIDGYIDIVTKTTSEYIITDPPGEGQNGVHGGNGVAIVYYNTGA